jgi:hypothetical protein
MEIDPGHTADTSGPSVSFRGIPVHAEMLQVPSELFGLRVGSAEAAWIDPRRMADA